MKGGLSNAISTISDLMDGDMDMQPTIQPVLDLSNVTKGANELNSLFYPKMTMSLVGQAALAFGSSGDRGQMTVKVDNTSVVEELRILRGEMTEMTARLERMQIVLDTGVMVGQMAAPMDEALGQRAIYRGRGN